MNSVKPSFFGGVLVIAFFLVGCDLVNPEETIPAAVFVKDYDLTTNSLLQGSSDNRITEVWITINNNFFGAYPIPGKVPILENGEVTIRLEAGIRDNGISRTPEIYPFYAPIERQLTLDPLKTDTLSLVTRYADGTQFAIIEDFESGNSIFTDIRVKGKNGGLEINEAEIFEGRRSARILLTQDLPLVEVASNKRFFNLNQKSPFVYLEVNYKSEVPTAFGIIGYETAGSTQGVAILDVGFLPKGEWNKIYFNLSPILANASYMEYQIAIQAFIPQTGQGSDLSEAEVYLDNIKLVHF